VAIRLAEQSEAGIEFGDLLNERLGRSGGARVIAFVLAWDRLRDELRRAPTADELAHRFGWDRSTAYRDLDLFRKATGEENPERIADLLWEAVRSGGRLGSLLAARVTDEVDERDTALQRLAEWEPDLTLEELESRRRARQP
jgi:hypothetical protein